MVFFGRQSRQDRRRSVRFVFHLPQDLLQMEEARSWQPGISAQKGTSAHQAQRRYQSVCLRGKTQNQLRSNENEIAFAKKIRPLRINNVNLQIVQKERFSEAAAKETGLVRTAERPHNSKETRRGRASGHQICLARQSEAIPKNFH